jgi:hypothetical protein
LFTLLSTFSACHVKLETTGIFYTRHIYIRSHLKLNMQQCYYCKRWFKNKQSVRAHLRWCDAWNTKKSGGFIPPPSTFDPYGQLTSTPNKMDPNYQISPGGGFTGEFDRRPLETAAGIGSQKFIKSVDICVIHHNCMVCPHCHEHLKCEDNRPLPASREGICPFCSGLFLY